MTSPKPEIEPEFVSSLLGEDELGVVIRAHTHIEATLNDLVELMIPFPEFLREMNLSYAQKVRLACAQGLKKQHMAPLLELGKIRNHFAHKLSAKLSKDRVLDIYNSLSSDDRKLVHMSYQKTNSQLLRQRGSDFRKLDPKDQFVLIAVSIKSMLLIAVQEMRRRN